MSQKTKQKRTKRLGIAPTLSAAASLTGLPQSVVSAAKAAGCGAFRSRGDVDCDKLLAWVADHPEIADSGPVNQALEEALKTRADRMLKEHKLAEARRRVIPVDEVKRTYTRSVLAAKSKLLGSEKIISMKIKMRLGLDDEKLAAIVEIVGEAHLDIAKEMAKGDWCEK